MAGSEIKVMWERILNYTITEQKTSNIHEFLKAHGYSSSLIRAIKEDTEGIRLNGEPVLARTLLTPGDQLAIRITETKFSENIVPSDLPLSIVYEDPDLLVINKPAGMPIHPSQGNYDNTLANACAWYFKEKGEPFVYRCINRLDRDTTGLLIIARHLYSASLLSAMMARREIHREYLGISRGRVTPSSGTITAPLGRKDGSIIERTIDFEHGESAITHYEVLEEKNGHSLVSLILETGRTHQIRIHMKYLGYPLIGDYLYNPDMEHIQRQALHAWKLSFYHPITGEKMQFTAQLPADMAAVAGDTPWAT